MPNDYEMTTQDFAYYLRHHTNAQLRGYGEIVLDWEPDTKSLTDWLIYLLCTLDDHITQLTKTK